MKGTRRCSAARAYLHPAKGRTNLAIVSHANVDRIMSPVGALRRLMRWQRVKKETFVARKEIILCAGALNSPQILLRSGVGPADEIQPHGIEMVHALPGVGQNLQDHIGVVSQFACTQPGNASAIRLNLLRIPLAQA